MNIEQNDQVYEQPKKSGKGLFACGGIGCIVLLLFCGGGIGLMAYLIMPVFGILNEAQTLAETNEQVVAAIGEDITFGPPQQESQNNETGEVTMAIPISGSNGSGTVRVGMKLNGLKFEKSTHTVELEDGQIIDLMGDDGLDLDIDEPGE